MPLVTIDDLSRPEAGELIKRAEGISAQYDQFLEQRLDGHERRPGIHASEVSGCERRAVYTMIDTEKKGFVPLKWRKRFQVGHALHGMLQEDFRQMGLNTFGEMIFEEEAKIRPDLQPIASYWNIHSSCDGIFTFYDQHLPELRVGLEIKTASPAEFEKMNKPKFDHIEQAHVYMACLDLPLMWFLYMNKGNQEMTKSSGSFLIKFDPEIWKSLTDRFRRWQDLIAAGQLPDRQEGIQCDFCPYAWTCMPNIKNRNDASLGNRWHAKPGR